MKTLAAQRMMLLLILISLTVAFTGRAPAAPPQDPPMEWGTIPRGDLAMSTYPLDENAPAIILCDYGETTFDNNLHLVFTRHTRIKLLAAAGFDEWGTHSVSAYSRDDAEVVSDIEGATYNLAPDGEIKNVRTIESSGDAQYDASCERAVRAVNPLEPVPEHYRKDFATVQLTFKPDELEH